MFATGNVQGWSVRRIVKSVKVRLFNVCISAAKDYTDARGRGAGNSADLENCYPCRKGIMMCKQHRMYHNGAAHVDFPSDNGWRSSVAH